MKILGRVYKQKDNYIAVKCASERVPQIGENVEIMFGHRRTIAQNRLYFGLLKWVVDNGLKDQGCLSHVCLHEELRDYFLAEKELSKGILRKIRAGSTKDLDIEEFSNYIDACDTMINQEYGICTADFWEMME